MFSVHAKLVALVVITSHSLSRKRERESEKENAASAARQVSSSLRASRRGDQRGGGGGGDGGGVREAAAAAAKAVTSIAILAPSSSAVQDTHAGNWCMSTTSRRRMRPADRSRHHRALAILSPFLFLESLSAGQSRNSRKIRRNVVFVITSLSVISRNFIFILHFARREIIDQRVRRKDAIYRSI